MLKRLCLIVLLSGILLFPGRDVSAGISVGASVNLRLSVAPGGMYFVGRPSRLILSPLRVTVGLFHGGIFRTRICGMGPGRIIFGGLKARPFHLHVRGPGVKVKLGPGRGPPIKLGPGRGRGFGHGHGHGRGHGRGH